jgi:hypothetical protein
MTDKDASDNDRLAEAEKRNDEVRAKLKEAVKAQDKTDKTAEKSAKSSDKP